MMFGIQNQIQIANVAEMMTARAMLPAWMPASTGRYGVAPMVPSVEPPATPLSELYATAPTNRSPKAWRVSGSNAAMIRVATASAPNMPHS